MHLLNFMMDLFVVTFNFQILSLPQAITFVFISQLYSYPVQVHIASRWLRKEWQWNVKEAILWWSIQLWLEASSVLVIAPKQVLLPIYSMPATMPHLC